MQSSGFKRQDAVCCFSSLEDVNCRLRFFNLTGLEGASESYPGDGDPKAACS